MDGAKQTPRILGGLYKAEDAEPDIWRQAFPSTGDGPMQDRRLVR